MIFSSVQPPIISLFSSTGSDPLSLFSVHCDDTSQSFIHFLNDTLSEPKPPGDPPLLIQSQGRSINQTVLHIQSPTLNNTYIQSPEHSDSSKGLGLRLPWLHIQVRHLDRDWSFEVGILDTSGHMAILRFSTFQVRSHSPCMFSRTCTLDRSLSLTEKNSAKVYFCKKTNQISDLSPSQSATLCTSSTPPTLISFGIIISIDSLVHNRSSSPFFRPPFLITRSP